MLNPRARENTPFYLARYFHQRMGSRFVYVLEAFFEPDRFKENSKCTPRCLSDGSKIMKRRFTGTSPRILYAYAYGEVEKFARGDFRFARFSIRE